MSKRFAVYTSSTSAYKAIADLTFPGKQKYCQRHGYDFINEELDQKRVGLRFERLIPIIESGEYDWVLFTGTDVLLTNHTIELESMVDNDYDLLIACDVNGVNDDVFMFRCCRENAELFSKILLEIGDPPRNCEQTAVAQLLPRAVGYKFTAYEMQWIPCGGNDFKVKYVPQRTFNSYIYSQYGMCAPAGEWSQGDFALHLCGMENKRRIALLNEYIPLVIR